MNTGKSLRFVDMALALSFAIAVFGFVRCARATDPPGSEQTASGAAEQPMHDMSAMDRPSMQGDARDPDYSDGRAMSPMPGMADSMNDNARFGKVMIDQLEYANGAAADGVSLDAQAYYGSDLNKLWLKVDGETAVGGHLGDTRTEALWDHAVSAFWDTQFGVRHDLGRGPSRSWAAIGIQGLSPYWFSIEAAAYVGQSGRTAARVEAEYDLLLTQQLILTPNLQLNAYGKNDPARRIGSGLSNVELSLRLRYEITRRFAPYVGVDWNRRVGKTADQVRLAAEPAFDHALVIGVHAWF